MNKIKLLSLDLSTTCTGWATFSHDDSLQEYGIITPKVKGVTTMKYPKQQLYKIRDIVNNIIELIDKTNPDIIVIEEVNLHKNRLAGKTLDGLHFILFHSMSLDVLKKLKFMDTDGKIGWRSASKLSLKLSAQDKILNAEYKKHNKKAGKGAKKIKIINKKDLAERYVNKKFKLKFDIRKDKKHEDMVDAIAMGSAFLRFGNE